MKQILISILLILFISSGISKVQNDEKEFPVLKGPYLGQKLPSLTPEIFAPGVVSRQHAVHGPAIFSSQGDEAHWTVMNDLEPTQLVFLKQVNSVWTPPQKVPFSDSEDDVNPFFSADGNTLYFKSTRDNSNTIWYVRREEKRWSDPVSLGSPFSSGGLAWQASITNSGTIYFEQVRDGFGTHDINMSDPVNGRYAAARKLRPPIKSDIDNWQVFIDPDEEYLMFGRYRQPNPSYKNGLYISFKKQHGSWTEPLNMGKEINGDHGAYCLCVSPDEKHFFFVSDMDNRNWHYDVYWINAKIIEELKPKK